MSAQTPYCQRWDLAVVNCSFHSCQGGGARLRSRYAPLSSDERADQKGIQQWRIQTSFVPCLNPP